jgi:hypothetical protein
MGEMGAAGWSRDWNCLNRVGRRFGFGDVPTIDGVRVAYLNQRDPFPDKQPRWVHKKPEWIWAVAFLCVGIALYIVAVAIAWVIDGFATRRTDSQNQPMG